MPGVPSPEHVTFRVVFLVIGSIEAGWCDPWIHVIEGATKARKRAIQRAKKDEATDRGTVDVGLSGDGLASQGRAGGRVPPVSSGQGVDLYDRFGC